MCELRGLGISRVTEWHICSVLQANRGTRNAASYAVTVSHRVTGWYTCSALQANRLKNTDNHMQTIIGEFL